MKNALLSVAAIALIATGCAAPPSVDEVSEAASFASETLIVEGAGASDSLSTMQSLSSLSAGWSAISGSNVVPYLTQVQPYSLSERFDTFRSGLTNEETARAQGQRVARFLRERVFIEENVEEKTGDALIFRVTGEDLCTPETTGDVPTCITETDKYELRIKARKVDGIELTLVLGPNRHEPGALLLSREHVGVRVNLGGIKGTIEYFASVNGETVNGLPRVFSGVFELILRKHGEKDYSATANVVEAIQIEVDDSNGGNTVTFSTAARSPVAMFRVNGIEKRVTFDLDVGETNISAPYSGIPGSRMYHHLAGSSYAFSAKEGDEFFTVAHVGAGDATSTIKLDDHELLTFNLNPASGRHFDVNITRDADGLPTLKFLPELDVEVGLHFEPLKQDPYHTVEPWQENETYRLRLTGSGGPIVKPVPANYETGYPGGLKIVNGELALTTGSGASVTVAAGNCLVRTTTTPPAEGHPLLGQYEAQACP